MPVRRKEIISEIPVDRVQGVQEIQSKLINWGKDNFRNYPWRSTKNQFHGLIAELMLQRTRAEQVLPIYIKFTTSYPNVEVAATEDPQIIFELLKPLGLFWRAEKIIDLINTLHSSGGNIPNTYSELVSLPGVGRYVASSFLSFHLGVKQSIIDSNVVRLYGRLFGFETGPDTRRQRWFIEFAEKTIPGGCFKEYNYSLLDFTNEICKPKPMCYKCILNHICYYYRGLKVEKGRAA